MATIFSTLDLRLREAIRAAVDVDADPLLGVAQNPKFGDYQSNVAMSLAKTLGEKTGVKANPRAVAEKIKAALRLEGVASEVSIAGPGFINVRLSPAFLSEQLQIMAGDARLGVQRQEARNVVVDYSGPNVAKEMHVGHLRSTIIGDAIVRLLAAQGHHVTRQNHIGDWGTQFGMLITFVEDSAGLPAELRDLEQFYRSAKQRFDAEPAFADRSRAAVVALQACDAEKLRVWQLIVSASRKHYEEIYRRLGVLLNEADERGESAYNAQLAGIVAELKAKGLAVESDGATAVFIDGPEKSPLIVQKTGGGYLYATTDLAAIRYRVEQLHANRIIYCHDSRQGQHFSQLFETARRAGWAAGVELQFAAFGTMLGEDGKPIKTREGDNVKLKDLLDEAISRALAVVKEKNPDLASEKLDEIALAIGVGAVKYADLSKDRASDYMFSFDQMLALNGNTAPYLQYAHARTCQILNKAQSEGIELKSGVKVALESPYELAMAKHLLRLDEVITIAARELKPHHLCSYLYDLSTQFSAFFENCPVIQSAADVRSGRLALCDLTRRVMAFGLELLGIERPMQM